MLFRPGGPDPRGAPAARDRDGVHDEPLMDVPARAGGVSGGRRPAPRRPRSCARSSAASSRSNDVDFTIPRGSIVEPDRPERRRQDDVLQHDHGRLQADRRRGDLRRRGHRRPAAARDHRARHRPDVPEHPPVPADDRARERPRRACTAACKGGIFGSILRTPRVRREEREARERAASCSTYCSLAAAARRLRAQPLLRRPAAARGRARAGDAAQAPAPRRADRGHEPAGDGRVHRLRRAPPRPTRGSRSSSSSTT